MAKRVFDICVAIVLIVLCVPIMILVALLVRLDSPGPIVFKQKRIGYGGKRFVIFKFRTMRNGSAKHHDIVCASDPRVTRIGKLLRSVYFDELPQLWNVLRGDMSLVGPRPITPGVVEMRKRQTREYERRFQLLPGLTGLPQIDSQQSERNNPNRAHLLNLYYARHRSICFDCKILLRTIGTVIRRRGI